MLIFFYVPFSRVKIRVLVWVSFREKICVWVRFGSELIKKEIKIFSEMVLALKIWL